MAEQARGTVKELLSTGSGKAGVIFLAALVLISIAVVATYPLDFGTRYWSNPVLWADNPKVAPPAWVNLIGGHRRAETIVFEADEPSAVDEVDGVFVRSYSFRLDYRFDEPPSFTSLIVRDITYRSRPPIFTLSISRPDGRDVALYQLIVPGPRLNETTPVTRYRDTPFRILLSGDMGVASSVSEFLRRDLGVSVSSQDLLLKGVDRVVFGTPEDDLGSSFRVLKGLYLISVDATVFDQADSIGMVRVVVGGSVYGALGTDALGRDLSVGLLFGFPVALFIGLVTSSITTLIGTVTGIVSGYIGGRTDTSIQRAADILANIPLLPILIFLAFIVGQKLWVVILILVAFGWPGLTILVRSMVLQIRSGQLVEASVALGSSRTRIMFRHIFPQIAPFVFAQMIFSTPAAILAEAALSFLGLGDPSLPTWGQILEYGFRNGGVFVGYWWWIIPPGLLIVLTAMTFVLLALGLEPVVNPRLRRVR